MTCQIMCVAFGEPISPSTRLADAWSQRRHASPPPPPKRDTVAANARDHQRSPPRTSVAAGRQSVRLLPTFHHLETLPGVTQPPSQINAHRHCHPRASLQISTDARHPQSPNNARLLSSSSLFVNLPRLQTSLVRAGPVCYHRLARRPPTAVGLPSASALTPPSGPGRRPLLSSRRAAPCRLQGIAVQHAASQWESTENTSAHLLSPNPFTSHQENQRQRLQKKIAAPPLQVYLLCFIQGSLSTPVALKAICPAKLQRNAKHTVKVASQRRSRK